MPVFCNDEEPVEVDLASGRLWCPGCAGHLGRYSGPGGVCSACLARTERGSPVSLPTRWVHARGARSSCQHRRAPVRTAPLVFCSSFVTAGSSARPGGGESRPSARHRRVGVVWTPAISLTSAHATISCSPAHLRAPALSREPAGLRVAPPPSARLTREQHSGRFGR